jgi:hypothetical protein
MDCGNTQYQGGESVKKEIYNSLVDLYKKSDTDKTEFWESIFRFLQKAGDSYFNKVNTEYNFSIFNLEEQKNLVEDYINKLEQTFTEVSTVCNQISARELKENKLKESNNDLLEQFSVLSKEKDNLLLVNKQIENQLNQSEDRVTAELRDKLKVLRDSVNTIPEYVSQIEEHEKLPNAFKKKLNSNIQFIYNEMLKRELWSEIDDKPKEIEFKEEKKLSIKDRKGVRKQKHDTSVENETDVNDQSVSTDIQLKEEAVKPINEITDIHSEHAGDEKDNYNIQIETNTETEIKDDSRDGAKEQPEIPDNSRESENEESNKETNTSISISKKNEQVELDLNN